jgi:hypothetical protein
LRWYPQPLAQIAVRGLLDQFGKRFNDLVLGVVDVLQAVEEQVVHRLDVFAEEAHVRRPLGDVCQKRLTGHEVPEDYPDFSARPKVMRLSKTARQPAAFRSTTPKSARQQPDGGNSRLSRRFGVRRRFANKQAGRWFGPQPRQGKLDEIGMRLATTSVAPQAARSTSLVNPALRR